MVAERLVLKVVTALVVGATLAHAQPKPPPSVCPKQLERGELGFWVGKWDVFKSGTTTLVAHSLIEKLYDGCAIRENWMPLVGGPGGSLSAWDPRAKRGHQTWVDATGATVQFDGKLVAGTMTLEGSWVDVLGPGKDGTVRMNYRRNQDGSVRQWGDVSQDGGKTWTPSFDLTYKPSR